MVEVWCIVQGMVGGGVPWNGHQGGGAGAGGGRGEWPKGWWCRV